jgi:hypothetical protein
MGAAGFQGEGHEKAGDTIWPTGILFDPANAQLAPLGPAYASSALSPRSIGRVPLSAGQETRSEPPTERER